MNRTASIWSQSTICAEAEAERAERDAKLTAEARKLRRRNLRQWGKHGLGISGATSKLREPRAPKEPRDGHNSETFGAIIELLRSASIPMCRTQIIAALPQLKTNTVSAHLSELHADGLILRKRGENPHPSQQQPEVFFYSIAPQPAPAHS